MPPKEIMNKETINQIEGGSRFDDYDWKEVVKYAPFKIEDVKEIIACVPGGADSSNWHYIMKLADGKFGYATGWCDYTGWGCQEGGSGSMAGTLADLLLAIPEKEGELSIRQTLSNQIEGKQPYGLITITKENV